MTLELEQLRVRPERGADRRVELRRGEIGLRQVAVDVEVVDRLSLGSLPRLPGAEDDAHEPVRELAADRLARVEARVVALHHHVEEHHSDRRVRLQDVDRFLAGVRGDQLDLVTLVLEVLQAHLGDGVDVGLVIHHEYAIHRCPPLLPGRRAE
jgi:hypothetical protein